LAATSSITIILHTVKINKIKVLENVTKCISWKAISREALAKITPLTNKGSLI